MQTNEIKIFDSWLPNTEYMFRLGLCLEGHKFIIPSGNSNIVLVFDMEKEYGKTINIGKNNNGTMSMCKCGESYWLAPRRPGAIISWNPLSNEVVEYMNYPEGFESGRIVFSKNYSYEGDIIIPPAEANKCLIFAEGKLKIDEDIKWKINSGDIVEYLFETETERYYRELLPNGSSRYFKIGKADNSLSTYVFYLDNANERRRKIIEIAVANNEIIKEDSVMGLQGFISGISKE